MKTLKMGALTNAIKTKRKKGMYQVDLELNSWPKNILMSDFISDL